MIVYLLTRMTGGSDLDEQRRVFEELLHQYPAAEADAALREVFSARIPRFSQDSDN